MSDYSHLFGWEDDQEKVEKILATAEMPFFGACSHAVTENTGMGKIQLLYKYVEQILTYFPELVQEIGDCTSFSSAHGVITLSCSEIAYKGENEIFGGIPSTEYIYAVSRNLIGGGQLGNQDGSVGAWVVEGLKTYGIVNRKKYESLDLTKYNPNLAREMGSPRGKIPQELINIGKEHPIQSFSLVESVEQCVDAIHNGYPVLFCSNQGFNNKRDSDGFLRPEGKWPHAMCGIAQDTEYKRPGICIENSWPKGWVSGPTRHGQPSGSFWVDLDVIRRMIAGRDTYVISNYKGYPARNLDWNVFKQAQDKAKNYE